MSNVDILLTINIDGFANNTGTASNPTGVPQSIWNNNIWMIAQNESVVSGQGSYALTVKARKDDTITWWETVLKQGTGHDMIVYKFQPTDTQLWNRYLSPLRTDHKQSGHVWIDPGSPPDNPTFDLVAYPSNLSWVKVINAPSPGKSVTLNYHLWLVKVDIRDSSNPKPVGYYYYDPAIVVQG